MLRKHIEVVVTDEDIQADGCANAIANQIKRALRPNYQDVEVDENHVLIRGREYQYRYETPAIVCGLIDAHRLGQKVHAISFALAGKRDATPLGDANDDGA